MAPTITITFDLFDSGCLPTVLRQQIDRVEGHMRVCRTSYSAEQQKDADDFLAQLRGCLEAVEAARR